MAAAEHPSHPRPIQTEVDDAVEGELLAVDTRPLTSLTVQTADGSVSALVRVASSRAGRTLVVAMLQQWRDERRRVRLVPSDRRARLEAGDSMIYVDLVALV